MTLVLKKDIMDHKDVAVECVVVIQTTQWNVLRLVIMDS